MTRKGPINRKALVVGQQCLPDGPNKIGKAHRSQHWAWPFLREKYKYSNLDTFCTDETCWSPVFLMKPALLSGYLGHHAQGFGLATASHNPSSNRHLLTCYLTCPALGSIIRFLTKYQRPLLSNPLGHYLIFLSNRNSKTNPSIPTKPFILLVSWPLFSTLSSTAVMAH